jgi:hypothetical protein
MATAMEIYRVCGKCHGDGQFPNTYIDFYGNVVEPEETVPCPACDGAGKILSLSIEAELNEQLENIVTKSINIIDRLTAPILIFPAFFDSVVQGNFLVVGDPNYFFGAKFYNSSNANGDQVNYKVYMGVGIYTFKFLHAEHTTFGILKLLIDGIEKASFDCYNSEGSQWNIIDTQEGIEVTEAGIKTVSLKIDGKNASSSGYYMNVSALYLYRTS